MKALSPIALALIAALGGEGGCLAAEAVGGLVSNRGEEAVQGTYLGVVIGKVPPALAAHLPPSVPVGQGVLVSHVQPDSPAAKGGIRPFDVLFAYDEQKLFTPDQLAALTASDKVGRKVKLQLVRDGEAKTLEIVLGQGATPAVAVLQPGRWPHHLWFHPTPTEPGVPPGIQSSFESLRIETLDGHRYSAVIEYSDEKGDRHREEFEGTRPELHEQITGSATLPDSVRRHLLNALDLRRGWQMEDWPMSGFVGPMDLEHLMRYWPDYRWPAL